MNWYEIAKQTDQYDQSDKSASKIQPVEPTDGTNFSNFLNSNFQNGWGKGVKRKKSAPKKDDTPAKEDGKGERVDVKAASEVRDVDLDDLWAKGHGRTVGCCGHVITSCRCKHSGDKRLERRVHELCEDCRRKKL